MPKNFDPADFRSRPLPKDHEMWLRQMTGIGESGTFPPEVLDAYWRRKVLADRCDFTITISMLIEIVASAGQKIPAPDEKPWILTAVESKELSGGERIVVRYKGKDTGAVYLRLHNDRQRVRVQIDGDSIERMVDVADVIKLDQLVLSS